jgi:hypothetical protein
MVAAYLPALLLFWKIQRLRRRIERDPLRTSYSDLAIAPVGGACDEELELYRRSDSARQAAARAQARGDLPRLTTTAR